MLLITIVSILCAGIIPAADGPNLLLVSESVSDYNILAEAAQDGVLVETYNPETTSLEELTDIVNNALDGKKAGSIAFVVHDYGEAKFYLTAGHTISLGSLANHAEEQNFWRHVGDSLLPDGRIDILACDLAKSKRGKLLVSYLEELTGRTVAASIDKTGNPQSGGNWILETASIDLTSNYFSEEKLNTFTGLLWARDQKLLPSDGAASDNFGYSVGIDGNHAIIGAKGDDETINQSGSAYIFFYNGSTWTQQAKLNASDPADSALFGFAVDISGDYALIGAYWDDDNGDKSGSAYVFLRSGTTWTQQAKLLPSDGGATNYFGQALSIDGDTAIISAPNKGTGAVYVFTRSGTTWSQQAKIMSPGSTSADNFGVSVEIKGDYAIIGDNKEDDGVTLDTGAAYVFHRSGTTWSEQAKLTASDAAEQDYFGASVDITIPYAIVGSYWDDDNGSKSGSAYIFYQEGTSWSQQAKITASDAVADDYFGRDVAIDQSQALVGAAGRDDDGTYSGAVYSFARSGTSWTQTAKIVPADGDGSQKAFGESIDIDGQNTIVGANRDDDNGFFSGSAYVLSRGPIVTVNSQTGGSTDKDGANEVASGGSLTINATADAGYAFSGFTGDVTSSSNPLTINNITADKTVTANFTRDLGTLKVNLNAGSSGATYTISGPSDFNGGSDLTGQTGNYNSAVPTGTYTVTFDNVANYDLSVTATSFTVASNEASGSLAKSATETVTGTYSIVQHNVAVTSGSGGSTDKDGDNAVDHGSNITIDPTGDEGYSFSQWSGDNTSTDDPLTLTNVTTDMAVTANFTRDTGTLNVNLTANGSGGSFSITGPADFNGGASLDDQTSNFSDTVPTGEYTVNFLSVPNYGVDITTTTFTVTNELTNGTIAKGATETISGTYVPSHNVQVTSGAGGSTDKDGANTVIDGGSITIDPTADEGYSFDQWSGDNTSTDDPLTLTNVTSDKAVTANFTRDTGTLNVNLNANGSGGSFTISGPADFNGGSALANQTSNYSSAVPTGNYTVTFSQVIGYGTTVTATSFVVNGKQAAGALAKGGTETVNGTYTASNFNVSVNLAEGGSTDKDGNNLVGEGGSITITANADAGYVFNGWTGDVVSGANPLTINNVTQDYSITPNFKKVIQKGSISANINGPDQARWKVVGNSAWLTSGAVVSGLNVGNYSVRFSDVDGYKTPDNQQVAVSANQTTTVNATYIKEETLPPTIHYFTSTPEAVEAGGDVTLSWQVKNADTVSIDAFPGMELANTGTKTTAVHQDTTFTLTASNAAETKTGHVFVDTFTKLNIDYFYSDLPKGTPLVPGDPVTLYWGTTGASEAEIGSELVSPAELVETYGSMVFTPEESTTYTLFARNDDNEITKKLTITCSEEAYINFFTATPKEIPMGNKVTLAWDAQGVDEVLIDPLIGYKDPVGSASVSLMEDTTFTLEAGDRSAKASVTINNDVPELNLTYTRKTTPSDTVVEVTAGEQQVFAVVVENDGTAIAESVKVQLQDNGKVVDEAIIKSVPIRGSRRARLKWTGLDKGKHLLKFIVDPDNVIGEFREDNNVVEELYKVVPVTGVDLVITNLSMVPEKAGTYRVSYTIQNVGKATSGGFQFQVYLAKRKKKSIAQALFVINDDHINKLKGGESKAFSHLIAPGDLPEKYFLIGKVDIYQAIDETNEDNNQTRIKFKE